MCGEADFRILNKYSCDHESCAEMNLRGKRDDRSAFIKRGEVLVTWTMDKWKAVTEYIDGAGCAMQVIDIEYRGREALGGKKMGTMAW